MTALWDSICENIANVTGDRVSPQGQDAIGGGCINQAFRLRSSPCDYFIKLNHSHQLSMFEAEARGLQEIVNSKTLRAPQPICWGKQGDNAYLVLEYLELGGGRGGMDILGQGLAAMHRVTGSRYGWETDNTIGSTPQLNTYSNDWITFWRDLRLGYQLELAGRNGFGGRLQKCGDQLLDSLPSLLNGHDPDPSLLHGDLWSGNIAIMPDGEPVIYDPAVYYGDREADLAMTELFGGFGNRFYAAYQDTWPVDEGYSMRKTLYNLYHILNHLNLFGGGYLSQSEGMIDRLLSEIR
ncbi:MAG: fructosamine kinase family protein [Gammaproteobacteria bacterium]